MQDTQNQYWVSGFVCCGGCCHTSGWRAAPGSPRLASAVDGNWTQGCTDRNLDQDRRQDQVQGSLQKPVTDEKNESLVIPQL